MMRVQRRTTGFAIVCALLVGSLSVVATAPAAVALTGSDFDPGLIISDQEFYSSSAMTELQIQSFLDLQIGSCSNNQCLNVLRVDTQDRARLVSDSTGQVRCGAFQGGSGLSAATVIFRAQAACGISAKVLLVTLQKEQGLLSNRAPSQARLDRAMGFACPDTAPCATDSLGFANQVYKGALQLNTYKAAKFGRQPGVHFVQYHPNAGCGGTQVNVQNFATAALYNYTPYQPNGAALANLTASGDACSSYGNRNFWVYYNGWFGSTGTAGIIEINRAYVAAGGESGPLGTPATEVVSVTHRGGGLVRGYAAGAIAWSQPRGAFVISGDIRDHFNSRGGIATGLGWPASPANANSSSGGGFVQAFQLGAITSAPGAGTHTLLGGVRDYFNATGSLAGPLRWPTSSEACDGSRVCKQTFQGGAIYWSPATSGRHVLTPFLAAYQASGETSGSLGWPITGTVPIAARGGGAVQAFDRGAIASSPLGAFVIANPIRDYFNSLGGISGAPGWPTNSATCASATQCSQGFQGGGMYWSTAQGGAFLAPAMVASFAAHGDVGGALGWPIGVTNTIGSNGGGTVQAFENGALASSAAGSFAISGGLRTYFNQQGGIGGSLGWPRSEQTCDVSQLCTQVFAGGTVSWSPTAGGRIG
ncbi:MAG: hypothetical protein H7226_13455 [Salinibacterium sp.]|nr:hypothetical protein [Salinibacterium sp.]